jgi:hypothetical protein
MRWPWKVREEAARARAQEATRQLERIEAQRPIVEHVANTLRRETVEINGWTQRAKRAFS